MSNNSEKPLRDLLNKMLKAYSLGNKLDEKSLIKSWEEIVRKMIAKHTTDLYYRDQKLYIKLDSAPLRQELSYAKSSIVEKLNQKAGKMMVKEIILR